MEQPFHSNFEGFAIQVREPMQEPAVQALVATVLGSGWTASPFGDRLNGLATRFDLTSAEHQLSVSEAWQMTYRLRALPGITYAEPLFEVAVSGRPDWNIEPTLETLEAERFAAAIDAGQLLCGLGPNVQHLLESGAPEWSLEQMRVPQAWVRFFPDAAKLPGQGVVIGHPDTGYQPHPEIAQNLLPEKGKDFLKDDPDPRDEMEEPPGVLIPNPGHGTATSSVIISLRGDQTPGDENQKFVSGVAPGAKLIPLRMTYSVVLVGMMKLAKAIEHAADQGAHVISISLGGLWDWRLQFAISYAQKRGVIIAAAAGNCVRFVVWPAAHEEVIAVATCNAKREVWVGSSRGKTVDVTAPGESVWHAQARKGNGGSISFGVDRGNGTSFAVAAVAGIAALWLSHHGREKLIERYGVEKIPFIFNRILRENCDPVPEWETGKFGAGLVNAEKVLAAALPERFEELMFPTALALAEHTPLDWGSIETFSHLFEQSLPEVPLEGVEGGVRSNTVLKKQLAELLGVPEAELPRRLKEVGQELAFHLATHPDLYRAFASNMTQQRAETEEPGLMSTKADTAPEPINTQAIREKLLSKETSKVLQEKLAVI